MEENEYLASDDLAGQSAQGDEVPAGAEVFTPIEQHTIMFYGKPIVVVRLPDGRPAVVMRYLCDNMLLDRSSQVRRIQRTKAIAKDLVYCLVETSSSAQKMPTLVLRSLPYWLLGVDPGRARPEMQEEILRYQEEAVDVLYTWAQAPRVLAAPTRLVPTEIPSPPAEAPGAKATHAEQATYHEAMALWHRWQADQHMQQWRGEIEDWRGSVEAQLEGEKAMMNLIPEILELLPSATSPTLTSAHQNLVKYYVSQLSQATGKHRGTIYSSLYTAFSVPRYQDIPESEWDKVEYWFKTQIEQARKK